MSDHTTDRPVPAMARNENRAIDLPELLRPLRKEWRLLLGTMFIAGVLGGAGSYLVSPQFTSTTMFIPPQQQQSVAASALASLGAVGNLVGAAGGVKSSADEYVSLMQSTTVSDRMIERYKLMSVYDAKYRQDARKTLFERVKMTVGKKDGLITVSVDDTDPERAAAMANQYVEELRRMTEFLAVSEAQQRRVFFEKQMQDTKNRLIAAQTVLQQSGFTAGAIKTEPRAAAEQYARVRAEAMTAEVRLQTLRETLADTAPEVRQQSALLAALRAQLDQLATSTQSDTSGPDYISKYREFKYQETLFDLMAKQYELARVDESREGQLVQIVDRALPAERKSSPKRLLMALASALAGLAITGAWLIARDRTAQALRA